MKQLSATRLTNLKSAGRTCCYLLLMSSAGLALHTQAATVTGSVGVLIELGTGCQINGQAGNTQPLDFGDVDFGQWMSLSAGSPNIDADTSGSAGGGIEIECNANIDYTIEIDDGLHFGAGSLRMEHTTLADEYVTYQLFTDATRATAWVPGTPVTYTSTGTTGTPLATVHHFYGRVAPQAQANAGVYQDTVQVTVVW